PADPSNVLNAARVLRNMKNVLLLVGGRQVLASTQTLAWRIAQATGAHVMADYTTARVARAQGRLPLERIPYVLDQSIEKLKRFEHIILVGTTPPVGFFAYPGKPSIKYPANAQLYTLARPDQEPEAALQ